MGGARYQIHDCGYGAFDIDDTFRQGKFRPKYLAVVATAHSADMAEFICAALNNREGAQNSKQQPHAVRPKRAHGLFDGFRRRLRFARAVTSPIKPRHNTATVVRNYQPA